MPCGCETLNLLGTDRWRSVIGEKFNDCQLPITNVQRRNLGDNDAQTHYILQHASRLWVLIRRSFRSDRRSNLGGVQMIKPSAILGGIVALGVLLGTTSGRAVAQMSHEEMQPTEQTGDFRRIDQPLWIKGAVTAGGLGLIGLELWWFLLSKPKSRKAATQDGVQEITKNKTIAIRDLQSRE
jgi:hypothetical protein